MNQTRIVKRAVAAVATVSMILGGTSGSAIADTFVFPHILETDGSVPYPAIANTVVVPRGLDLTRGKPKRTPVAFDTQFTVTYIAGLPGSSGAASSAQVDIYLFDDSTGDPMKSASTTDVCNPCSFVFGATNRRHVANVEDLIENTGGFPTSVMVGYAIVVVTGDTDNVDLLSFVTAVQGKALEPSTVFVDTQARIRTTPTR